MMIYRAHIHVDGTVSLTASPQGLRYSPTLTERDIELSEQDYKDFNAKMATHDLKFDKVKERLVARKRKS